MRCRVLAEFDGVNAGYNSRQHPRLHDVDPYYLLTPIRTIGSTLHTRLYNYRHCSAYMTFWDGIKVERSTRRSDQMYVLVKMLTKARDKMVIRHWRLIDRGCQKRYW